MKLEEYECVKTKRRAQARIYEQTKDLTPEQLVAHYQRLGETARQRQAELRARAQTAASVQPQLREAQRGPVQPAAPKSKAKIH